MKYLVGKQGENSSAYNPLSGKLENGSRGDAFIEHETDKNVRAAIRNRQIEINTNAGYDLINGLPRLVPVVPQHELYNPNLHPIKIQLAGKPLRENSNM